MSSWRHQPKWATQREWHEIDASAGTVEVLASGFQQWLVDASAGSDHSSVGAVYGAGGRVPDSIVAGGHLVNEPCCDGQDFTGARWEAFWDPREWPAWRCAGCGLDIQPDVWLDVWLHPDSVRTDRYGGLVSCRLPAPEAFAEAAEIAFGGCLDQHRQGASERCGQLVQAVSDAVHGVAGTVPPDWVTEAPIIASASDAAQLRQFQPAAIIDDATPGAVTVGYADFAELGEQPAWVEQGAFVGPDPSRVAARLGELWLPGDADDIEDAWWSRVHTKAPRWLLAHGVEQRQPPPQRHRSDSGMDPVEAVVMWEMFF